MSARTITPAPLSAPTNTPKPAAAARTKLLLEGPILPTLLRLAAPNVLNLLAFVGVIVFDGFFLGRIGTNALAGASLAFPFVMLVLQTTNSGMGAGVTSAIARALGAGKRDRADELVFHALFWRSALGVVFSTPDVADCTLHFRMDGRHGAKCCRTHSPTRTSRFGGAICITVLNLLGNAVRGTGNMSLHAGVLVGCVVAHIVLSPLLIFGWGPVPALGPAGAGWGLVIPFAVGSLIMIRYLRSSAVNRAAELPRHNPSMGIVRRYSQGRRSWPDEHGDYQSIHCHFDRDCRAVRARGRHWLRDGSPARIHHAAARFWLRYRIVAMVGTNWGAGQYHRARDRLDGRPHTAAVCGAIGLIVAILPSLWLGLFSNDPEDRAHWRAVSSDCWTGVSVPLGSAWACFS